MPLSRPDSDAGDSRWLGLPGLPGLAGLSVMLAPDSQAGRSNLMQLVQLRWLAVAGQLATVVSVHYTLNIRLPVAEMLTLLAVLLLFNLACWIRTRWVPSVSNAELFAGLLVDVAVLSGQLYYSGGVTNPFVFLYLLQIAVGAVLLPARFIWPMVWLTAACFLALTQWHLPLLLPDLAGLSLPPHYVGGLLICFAINASLLVTFIHRISGNLRQRDARLADLRQRAAEEEHIVRMGLLASGAAHELGTPLSTLSVILGDWAHMAPFAGDPELREEIEEMQVQLRRCKAIVSGILMSAGEMRGEAPMVTTLHTFLGDLVEHWRRTRTSGRLQYRADSDLPDLRIVSDVGLKQMIDNILDNAQEAAPGESILMRAYPEDDQLVLCVRDRGPGFLPEMLERLGKPYQSSKGRPGGGLGLFLALNVTRSLGGRLQARNRAQDEGGGAEVEIRLPLSALVPQGLADNGGHDGR
ncbi:two-component system, sensor histidine kinase RegB [Roseateles sp. YR242]|uniref:ATP-binding protein n=1 Tax=Roseateles sp. YR242 TaxID=1855305 RepID=UPI0008BE9F7C|nr:ATP-binding protein [Roseateles sp. YR242]SEK94213.1 two-component system, sensor histidine kinase RegB [Roseateles sp. YR242]